MRPNGRIFAVIFAITLLASGLMPIAARAYNSNGRWSVTATDGTTGPVGTPITVTWSIVDDGTDIPSEGESELVSFLDGIFGTAPGDDYTERPWFTYLEAAFDRWSELGGMTYVYEPEDDGADLGTEFGIVGIRGDVRLGGAKLDGPANPLAQTGFLDHVDVTFDTNEAAHFGNSSQNYRRLRNTLMHELGHTLGLGHVTSNSSTLLMETSYQNTIEGPQLDEVRALHWLYGDVLEKQNGGAGNDQLDHATSLGVLTTGTNLSLGVDGASGVFVSPTETDFVSIASSQDEDFFEFEITSSSIVDIVLTPVGTNYNQLEGNPTENVLVEPSMARDLELALFRIVDEVPMLVSLADTTGLGEAEELTAIALSDPGSYFLRVRGTGDDVQLYQLDLDVAAGALAGDYNLDGSVDAADYTVWRNNLGGAGPAGDGSGPIPGVPDGLVDGLDFQWWKQNFGTVTAGHLPASGAEVPEPAGWSLIWAVLATFTHPFAPWYRCKSLRNSEEANTNCLTAI